IAKIRRFRRREKLVDEFGYKIVPSLNREWKKHKLNRSNWNIGDPHRGGDLVEVTDMSMRVFFVMTEELFVLDKID
ncbi:hypothetical protein Tco_0538820, partial [Tanacetum coccineum]